MADGMAGAGETVQDGNRLCRAKRPDSRNAYAPDGNANQSPPGHRPGCAADRMVQGKELFRALGNHEGAEVVMLSGEEEGSAARLVQFIDVEALRKKISDDVDAAAASGVVHGGPSADILCGIVDFLADEVFDDVQMVAFRRIMEGGCSVAANNK